MKRVAFALLLLFVAAISEQSRKQDLGKLISWFGSPDVSPCCYRGMVRITTGPFRRIPDWA